jgi:hypothetical protein
VLRHLILAGPLLADWERATFPRVFESLASLEKKLYEWSESPRGSSSKPGRSLDERFETRFRTELLQRAYGVDIGAIRIGTTQAVDIRDLFVPPKLTFRKLERGECASVEAVESAGVDAPLSLIAARQMLERPNETLTKDNPRHSAVETLTTKPRVVLVGLPGSGKSTLLEWMQVQLAETNLLCPGPPEQAAPIPILLRVRQFEKGSPPAPTEFVARCMHSGDWAGDMPDG